MIMKYNYHIKNFYSPMKADWEIIITAVNGNIIMHRGSVDSIDKIGDMIKEMESK
jgi:hypothetical protein